MSEGEPVTDDATPLLEVRSSSIQGRGVFALRPIPPGTRIIEYTGEVISEEEGDRRYDEETMDRHLTYLFLLDDGRCIDGATGDNEARYINHSCDPNCETIEEDCRIWIQSIRPIEAGEELTYDYSYDWVEGDEDLRSFYVCHCGTASCRGTILALKEEPAADAVRGDE